MKNKTFYVQITGCEDDKCWYADRIGKYMPITREIPTAYIIRVGSSDYYIKKTDCRRVYLQEQAIDIDGEPLECGDEIKMYFRDDDISYINAKYAGFYANKYIVDDGGNYFILRERVRKIKQDHVDPIEAIWKKLKRDFYFRDDVIMLKIIKLIKKCIESKNILM